MEMEMRCGCGAVRGILSQYGLDGRMEIENFLFGKIGYGGAILSGAMENHYNYLGTTYRWSVVPFNPEGLRTRIQYLNTMTPPESRGGLMGVVVRMTLHRILYVSMDTGCILYF
jgi:hypothetical protein